MNFDFFMPVKLLTGENVIRKNSAEFALGKKAMIVTGKHSAKASGALDDVTASLGAVGAEYVVFDKITENPPIMTCFEGGRLAREEGVDFIVAIGGGSPMDAAKAIAVFAVEPDYTTSDLISKKPVRALPLIAVPTTSGTGSEADPTGVVTLEGGKIKKSFGAPCTYPKVSFLDPRYTESLNIYYTESTALDALCHCIESYLSPKSTEISRLFAADGAAKLYRALEMMSDIPHDGSMDEETVLTLLKPLRYTLMYGACDGGIAINRTGTGFNHPLGYNLTLYRGVPHGRACGTFMGEYFDYNSRSDEGKRLIAEICRSLGDSPETVAENVVRWSDVKIGSQYGNPLTDKEIDEYLANVGGAKNYQNSPYVLNDDEKRDIYRKLFS